MRYSGEIRQAADQIVRNLVLKIGWQNYFAIHYRRGQEFLTAEMPSSKSTRLGSYRLGLGTVDAKGPMLRVATLLTRDRTVTNFDLENLTKNSSDVSEVGTRAQEYTRATIELQARTAVRPT